ncbi:hypothetical protein PG997_005990 [Apiospora hydei]|uniref:3,4-dihydroxy-2-butanone-4-phosphate synthase n=1 Tax=Apiospora hydei TaxID=1337664 RepID=A0ABR1WMJ1_9PEZI
MPSAEIEKSQFDSIPDAIAAFRDGEFIVVLDDPSRENEGDLIISAQSVTTEQMAFMIRYSSGYMVTNNQDLKGTAYTLTVDGADESITTGISAHDRALTCRTLADAKATPASFRRPGHVLPLRARDGGVRVRRGHTEAAVDFCRLAGVGEVAAICEMVEDGEEVPGKAIRQAPGMMRAEGCIKFARTWGLKVCTIEDLVNHIEKTEGKYEVNGSS